LIEEWFLKPTGENRLEMVEYKSSEQEPRILVPISSDYVYKLDKLKTYGVLVGLNTLVVIRIMSKRTINVKELIIGEISV
jgi:hypothetical protein